ncbi:MAG TPA: DUF4339 domain-containing protein, partial [Luteolibacter sp.]|nr:DUF4339 domain-containing protein [Luteolibacter sp.]
EAARQRAEEAAKMRAECEARAAEASRMATEAAAQAEKAEQSAKQIAAEAANKAAADQAAAEAAVRKAERKAKRAVLIAKSVWYYTCEGERLGPISFEELRAMAAEGKLDPRLDMVWKQGTEQWLPAGQTHGLFERNGVSAVEKKEESKKPAIAPAVFEEPKAAAKASVDRSQSWPGARRRSLILVTLLFPIAWQYGLTIGSPFLTEKFGDVMMGKILPLAAFVPLLVIVHFALQRFANLGMSRWWLLGFLAPLLNLWVGHRCFACPSGYAYHKKLGGPGIALAILYWLVIAGCVLAFGAFTALFFGFLENQSDLLKRLPQMLRGLAK